MKCKPDPKVTWLPDGWKQCTVCQTQWGGKDKPNCFKREPKPAIKPHEPKEFTQPVFVEDDRVDYMEIARWGKLGMYYD